MNIERFVGIDLPGFFVGCEETIVGVGTKLKIERFCGIRLGPYAIIIFLMIIALIIIHFYQVYK